jgi:hypothetical protein
MTDDMPDSAPRSAADAPEVIYLPDGRQQRKQIISGSEKRQRQHVVQFRTDDAELAELRRRAWDSGRLSVGAFCRKRALGDPGVRHARGPAPPDVRLLALNNAELNRVGNNLNQIAKALNRGGDIDPFELRAAITELQEVLTANRRALGYGRKG